MTTLSIYIQSIVRIQSLYWHPWHPVTINPVAGFAPGEFGGEGCAGDELLFVGNMLELDFQFVDPFGQVTR